MVPDTPLLLAAGDGDLGIALAAVVVFGVGAQFLASRLRIPSVLLLLLGGVVAGPGLDVIDPDALLGDLLFPVVSLAVGVLLFEGGLGLRFGELERQGRGPIIRLVTVGVVVTWVVGALAALAFIGPLDANGAILLGSILVVSGPTVVLPLIRFARVREPVNGILRWEGIFIDPVGATLAIVVLDAVIEDEGTAASIQRILTTAGAGTVAGLLGAAVLTFLFARHLVPDNLHNPFTLAVVVAAFAGADVLRPEAGLFATTVMGVALANQRRAPVAHIREFEEDLGQLILAGLFILLGARIEPDQLLDVAPGALALAAVLILVGRPLAVYASTVGSSLTFVERAYLVCLSPRGIVAAAVSALFALELEEAGQPVPELVPVTFIVIVVTVTFSAIAARLGAKRFRVARPEPRGVAFIGGPDWAVDLATWLADHEVPSLVVTNDPRESAAASRRGVLTYTGQLDSEDLELALESVGVNTAIAVSRLQVLNSLGIDRALESVGRANVFHLPLDDDDADSDTASGSVIARRAFGRARTQREVESAHADGHRILAVDADGFDRDALAEAIPLLEVPETGAPVVLTTAPEKAPGTGTVRLYLAPASVAHRETDDVPADPNQPEPDQPDPDPGGADHDRVDPTAAD